MLCELTITPLLSFKGSKPKNVLISIKKNEKYVEKIENDFIFIQILQNTQRILKTGSNNVFFSKNDSFN